MVESHHDIIGYVASNINLSGGKQHAAFGDIRKGYVVFMTVSRHGVMPVFLLAVSSCPVLPALTFGTAVLVRGAAGADS